MNARHSRIGNKPQVQFLLALLVAGTTGYLLEMIPSLQAATKVKVVTQRHVMTPMRDGVRLSAWIYLPTGQGPWPVLMEQRYSNVRGARTRHTELAKHGYVVAGINFRGTAESEGTFVGYRDLAWGPKRDRYDVPAWLARPPWSNG